jgi:hypothetical protein
MYQENKQGSCQKNNASVFSNPLVEDDLESSSKSSSVMHSCLSDDDHHQYMSLEYNDDTIFNGDIQSPQIRASAARLRSSSEYKHRHSRDGRLSCWKEIK